jgi:predicted metal-dependent HD superfamily phosphohydrolase
MDKNRLQGLLDKWRVRHDAGEVLSRWSEPHRHYHGAGHLNQLVDSISLLVGINERIRDLLLLVAVYHDIVYRPGDPDNERLSAEYFMSGVTDPGDAHRDVAEAIVATSHHDWRACTTEGARLLSNVFNRLDMSVVESDMAGLLDWERGIRAEYGMYGDDDYRRGRTAFLRSLLDKYPHNRHNLQALIDKVSR